MTPTQFRILDMLSFVFSPGVVEAQLSINFPRLNTATTDEDILCELTEDEQFFIKMIPSETNKNLLVSHQPLVAIMRNLCWEMIRSNHSLDDRVIGLRDGWKVVRLRESHGPFQDLPSMFGRLVGKKIIEPKEMN